VCFLDLFEDLNFCCWSLWDADQQQQEQMNEDDEGREKNQVWRFIIRYNRPIYPMVLI
jgi:hypothetical protein